MKFGIVTSAGTVHQYIEMAKEAEAHGWDGVFAWDDITVGPMDSFDAWVTLGAMAAVTERVTLGSMVFSLARRRPWKVARETVTVDRISNGRFVLPVGFGGEWDGGYSRVNTDTTDRKSRREKLDECLEILELAWTGEPVTYSGKHYQCTDLVFNPGPVSQPRIPVWTVGAWPFERSLARSARWDGVIAAHKPAEGDEFTPIPPETIASIRDWMSERRETMEGFDIIVEGVTSGTDHVANQDRLGPLAEAGATWWIESRWGDDVTGEVLLERIRQGPPRQP